jgi:hypothetical protein
MLLTFDGTGIKDDDIVTLGRDLATLGFVPVNVEEQADKHIYTVEIADPTDPVITAAKTLITERGGVISEPPAEPMASPEPPQSDGH